MDVAMLVERKRAQDEQDEAREVRGAVRSVSMDGSHVGMSRDEVPGLTAGEISELMRRREYRGRDVGYQEGRQHGVEIAMRDRELELAEESRAWVAVTLEIVSRELHELAERDLWDLETATAPPPALVVPQASLAEFVTRLRGLLEDVQSTGLRS